MTGFDEAAVGLAFADEVTVLAGEVLPCAGDAVAGGAAVFFGAVALILGASFAWRTTAFGLFAFAFASAFAGVLVFA